jgi:S-DNA-T family DNA segregation ATPase FtsK/SpoIIIE
MGMRLKATIRQPHTTPGFRHVQITADATATAGDVARALVASGEVTAVGSGSEVTFRMAGSAPGSGRILAPTVTLLESGLRSGAILDLVSAPPTAPLVGSGGPIAVLKVVEGPHAGAEFPLAEGNYRIGRLEGDILLDKDPMVSGDHARLRVSDKVEIIDNRSANGVLVGGVQVNRVELRSGDQATLGSSVLEVTRLQNATEASSTSTDIMFNRSPLVLRRPAPRKVELPAIPTDPQQAKFPWLAMAAPLVMGAVTYLLTHNALSLVFVALSPIIMIGNWIDQRFRIKRQHVAGVAAFEAGLATAGSDLDDASVEDRADLEAMYPSTETCLRAAGQLTPLLWSRRPEHPEFLHVRLGTGDIPALTTIDRPRPGGIAEFVERARQLAHSSLELNDAPIAVDLRSVGGVGLCGPRPDVDDVARALATQLTVLHSPAEVVLACLTSTSGRARWAWLDWMPHTSSPHSPLGGPHLASDAGTGRVLLARLEELVDQRRTAVSRVADRGPVDGEETVEPPVLPSVVVIADDASVERARLVRIAERGPDVGVYVVWLGLTVAALPAACRAFVEVGPGHGSSVGLVRRGLVIGRIATESVDTAAADRLARQLAPVVDAGAPVADESDLPRTMSVVTLLGREMSDQPEAVLAHWRENRSLVNRAGPPQPLEGPSTLRALVGHAGSEEFVLDLRTHGPHALVGGTTGAGKSEFLQAWVLGIANAYSPDRVTFLFVDYKGGAAFAKCVELPHFVGLVTDLNTHLVRRALKSLRAELRHREHLLNEKGAKDLIELEKTGDPDCPPSLIIVVDEFAALVSEVPEFVDGVVDVAARGRSLGLHLILATQRPAGVIKDNLRANTNLRVALRMADEHDSTDVLGTAMAAHFDPSIPGRGAAKTGPGRITQFQSGFPGARTPHVATAPPIHVSELDFGVGQVWKMAERPNTSEAIGKDIERVVATIAEAARRGRVREPRRPWLDPISAVYDIAALNQRADTAIVLGVMDNPDEQDHVIRHFHPDTDGNLLYVGSSGSGKSTALRSLAIAASITPDSGPVQIYALDFAGGGLAALESLPSVGAIINGDDEERVGRLLRMLAAEAERRAEQFSSLRASTLSDFRTLAGRPAEPRLLVLLDGFGTFREEYEATPARSQHYNMFVRLLGEGRALGIHVAMSADRPMAVPNSVLAAFPRKLCLRQATDDNYLTMGVPKDVLTLQSPPGRCMEVGNPQELQLAILGDDIHVASQAKKVEELGAVLRARGGPLPEPIRSLPTLIPASAMPTDVRGLPVLGVRDVDLAPMGFDPRGIVIVAGLAQSGRTSAVRWLAESIRRRYPATPLVHLAPRRSPLSALDIWQNSAVGGDASEELVGVLKDLASNPAADDNPLMAIFVEGLPEFVGTKVESAMTELVKLCRRNGHLMVVDGETTGWGSSWAMLTEARNARTGILLQPDSGDGDNVVRTSLPRCKRADFPVGRGYWVTAGRATRVQLPLVD